ncbi:formate/nitrite transporter family protein [Streptococcus loxodontisalivarius]|uniref:Formate/nitrite transporter n=1 Tax=Streptococcus loxodontisalivarius TaxID=1349415 RepID=A0ABS2PQZ5_9STRE|nr:formate/nitrite transporter family protein [Streptococcus loxodontisalivarius]MBM7642410.1 formate/nitrite transporter [Streptococcus loxodontisalivarius]
MFTPKELVEQAIQSGQAKANNSYLTTFILGIFASGFIALAGVAVIRVMALLPKEFGSLSSFIGGLAFPFGLVALIILGGELVTGNMFCLSMALFDRKISLKQWGINLLIVSLANLVGAVLVAYFFGYLSATLTGDYAPKTLAIAQGRLGQPLPTFFSAVACNLLVSSGIYMAMAAKDVTGKVVTASLIAVSFIIVGYQHVVANMFFLFAGYLAGGISLDQIFNNLVIVWFGNLLGGAGLLAGGYFTAYKIGFRKKSA